MDIQTSNSFIAPDNLDIEIVERKGIGHPDTVADGIAESISVEYSRYCLENFGVILHHNVDKINALGGLAKVEWGSDEMLEPIRIILNGRISESFAGQKIPVHDICVKAAKSFLAKALPYLDPDKHYLFIKEHTTYSKNPRWFNPESIDDLPEYKSLFANDTSAVAAGSPLSVAERLALSIEGFFYDLEQKPRFKQCGQDIKVMVIRRKRHFEITVCCPLIAKYCPDINSFWQNSDEMSSQLSLHVAKFIGDSASFNLNFNTCNKRSNKNAKDFYVLVGGSALDYGEEGLVGRGNNRSGIIPMFRTFSMEAAFGKNPVYHVGKVLGVAADGVSRKLHETLGCKNEVMFVARNGDPLFNPSQVVVKTDTPCDKNEIEHLVEKTLQAVPWTERIVKDSVLVPRTGNLMERVHMIEL